MTENNYFTVQELSAIKSAMNGISGVGFKVHDYSSSNEQMKAFFNKAKLWRVVKTIISTLYIERLASGKMFLNDLDGNQYTVVRKKEA